MVLGGPEKKEGGLGDKRAWSSLPVALSFERGEGWGEGWEEGGTATGCDYVIWPWVYSSTVLPSPLPFPQSIVGLGGKVFTVFSLDCELLRNRDPVIFMSSLIPSMNKMLNSCLQHDYHNLLLNGGKSLPLTLKQKYCQCSDKSFLGCNREMSLK